MKNFTDGYLRDYIHDKFESAETKDEIMELKSLIKNYVDLAADDREIEITN